MLSTILLIIIGSSSLVLAGYPDTFSAGYGFITHGGIGHHGHYLPAVARVKVHKDPFQSHYSLDEEGPTHYKYVRQSSSNHAIVHQPLVHQPLVHQPIVHQPLVHHHHAAVVPGAGIVGIGGGGHHHHNHGVGYGAIGGIGGVPAAVGYGNPHLYGGYAGAIAGGGYPHAHSHAGGLGYGGGIY